jgi:fructose-1,6-bisphosphatase/inositol monophosphatase family enzyme
MLGSRCVVQQTDPVESNAPECSAERLISERIASAFPEDAIIGEEEADVAGTSGRTWIIDPWKRSAFNAILDTGANVKTWGDGYGWAMVVEGRADVIVDPSVSRWDVAAMPVLFAEAGGRYSDFSGNPIAQKGSSVATNGLLHDQLLALLNETRD